LVASGVTLTLTEHFPASFEIFGSIAAGIADGAQIAVELYRTKAAGVRAVFVYYPQPLLDTLLFQSATYSAWASEAVAGSFSDAIYGLATDNYSFIFVGQNGEIQKSKDYGESWEQKTAAGGFSDDFKAVCWNGAVYCAVGENGSIQTSSDLGETWTARSAAGAYAGDFEGVFSDQNGNLVAVGTAAEIQSSPDDGVTWTARVAGGGFAGNFYAVTHDQSGLWCAVGTSASIQTSPDFINWTARAAAGAYAGTFFGAGYGHGIFTIAGTAAEIQTSSDGAAWVARSAGGGYAGDFYAVAGDKQKIIVVGTYSGGQHGLQTSSDAGVTWAAETGDASFSNTLFAACSMPIIRDAAFNMIGGALGEIETSYLPGDFRYKGWVSSVTPTDTTETYYEGFAYNPALDVWVAAGASSANFERSTDGGINWTAQSPAGGYANDFRSICWNGTVFCAVGDGTEIQTSTDGITWVSQTVPGAEDFFGVASDHNGNLVAVGTNGEIISSINDGVTWVTQVAAGAYGGTFRAAVHDQSGLWVIVGDSAEIQTSPDFVNWTARTAGAAYAGNLRGVTFARSLYVICGASGEIQTSPDGITWTSRSAFGGFSNYFYATSVIRHGTDTNGYGPYCVVGQNAEIQFSDDGITWISSEPEGSLVNCYAVAADTKGALLVSGNTRRIDKYTKAAISSKQVWDVGLWARASEGN
jgi:hypothetical protein